MARPKRKRMVCWEPDYIHFQPDGISPSEQIILSVDEYEVIRLVDFEKKTHGLSWQIVLSTASNCALRAGRISCVKKMAAAGEARAEHGSKHRQSCLRKGDKQ